MAYQTTDPEHFAPPDPLPLSPVEELVAELSEDAQVVEWMGLSLYVGIAEHSGTITHDEDALGRHNYLVTWYPNIERKATEAQALAEIIHPQLGRQFHEPETVDGLSCAIADGQDLTESGAFGSIIDEKDAAVIIQAAIKKAAAKVSKGKEAGE